jgi:Uma2 family endonuclease
MAHQSILPPVRGVWYPMTWEAFLEWSPDEGQSEWVDGRGIAYASNCDRHVQLVVFLTQFLGVYVRVFAVGQLYVEQMLMRLPHPGGTRPSGRMPDAFVVGHADKERVRQYWFEGPALLAVEVLSEDSADRDLREKRDEYARGGVREYLILDARPDRDEFTYLRLSTSR